MQDPCEENLYISLQFTYLRMRTIIKRQLKEHLDIIGYVKKFGAGRSYVEQKDTSFNFDI